MFAPQTVDDVQQHNHNSPNYRGGRGNGNRGGNFGPQQGQQQAPFNQMPPPQQAMYAGPPVPMGMPPQQRMPYPVVGGGPNQQFMHGPPPPNMFMQGPPPTQMHMPPQQQQFTPYPMQQQQGGMNNNNSRGPAPGYGGGRGGRGGGRGGYNNQQPMQMPMHPSNNVPYGQPPCAPQAHYGVVNVPQSPIMMFTPTTPYGNNMNGPTMMMGSSSSSSSQPPVQQQQQQQQQRGVGGPQEQQQQQQQAGNTANGGAPAATLDLQPPQATFDAESLKVFEQQYAELCDEAAVAPPSLNYSECIKTINEHDVTFVLTDTGSGKSSLLPKHILDADPNAKILSSQTRRSAALSLAHRVAELRDEQVGTDIGYWVRGDHKGSFDSRLLYITSYLLFLHIVSNPDDFKATHIIIDEFHERNPDTEITLSLLRLALRRGMKFKLVLLSATADTDQWKEYFQGFTVGEFNEIVPRFKIHEWYMEDVSKMVTLAPVIVTPEEVDTFVKPTTSPAIYMVMREIIAMLATRGAVEHAILVFLPGRNEISRTLKWVEKFFPDTLDPIEWFADIDIEKIREQIERKPSDNRKKIYLATDIAEVSVTVPDAVFIIDCGLSRKPRIDPRRANTVSFPPLETVTVMRSSLRQRRGRVGRVRQGIYFSLLARETLPFLRAPEGQIVNTVLDTLTLHVLQMCENPKTVFDLAATQPKDVSLRLSLLKLLDNGAIVKSTQQIAESERRQLTTTKTWRLDYDKSAAAATTNSPADAAIDKFYTTAKGQVIQFLPLKVSCADLVFWGMITGIVECTIVAACIAEVGTPFYTNAGTQKPTPDDVERTRRSMLEFSQGAPSDIVASVSLVGKYKSLLTTTSDAARQEWCAKNSASMSRLDQILLYERSVLDAIADKMPGVAVNTSPEVLEQQLLENARTLDFLIGISFSTNSIWVINTAAKAQQLGFVGNSIFMRLKALADNTAASACGWPLKTIVVPTSLRLTYSKLLGHTSVQFQRKEFNALSMCTSADLVYYEEVLKPFVNPDGSTVMPPMPPGGKYNYICRYSRQNTKKYCRVSAGMFEAVIMFREAVCAKMNDVFQHVGAVPDVEKLAALFAERGSVPQVPKRQLLPRFIVSILRHIAKEGVEDLTIPDNFSPTHRSLLRAGGKTSVMPFDEADEISVEATAPAMEEVIED